MQIYWRLMREKNFAALLLGQSVSRLGDGIGGIVITWTVLEVTNSPWMVALSLLAQTVPPILLSLIAGHAADRYRHRSLMILADLVRMAATAAAALYGWTGVLSPWQLMLTAFVLACGGSFFGPARAAIMPHIVAKRDLQAANGLMTGAFHVALLAGALVGGWLLRFLDVSTLLFVDALTFGVSILGLVVLPATLSAGSGPRLGALGEAKEGLWAVWRTPSLAWVVGTFWVGTFFAGGFYQVGRTLMVAQIGAGSVGLGALSTAMGIGLMLGSLWVGKTDSPYKARTVMLAWAVDGALLVVLALLPGLPWALAVAFLSGVTTAYINVPTATLIQAHGREQIGRITGYWTVSIWVGESASLMLAAPLFAWLSWQAAFGLVGSLLFGLALIAAYLAWRVRDDLTAGPEQATPAAR